MNVTFDTNCIIALDEDEDDAPYLRRIIQSAPEQGLTLRVVGISASEATARWETEHSRLRGKGRQSRS